VRSACLLAVVASPLAACAPPLFDVGRTETVLPLSRVDGGIVESVTTDISDLAMAWTNPTLGRELSSEEELLDAEEQKELALEVTGIVVNGPVTRSASGQALPRVR
jgi:hypothetical protein